MDNFDHIHIFSTNIRTDEDLAALAPVLDAHAQIERWTVDQEDEDCVLRIVSHTLTCPELIELVGRYGYHCAELP